MMVMVNTDLETAQERNANRVRTLPPTQVEKMWQEVQSNIGHFQGLFGGQNMIIIDNSESRAANAGTIASGLYGKINAWAKVLPRNRVAQNWILSQGGRI
jgi:hypothetical protein